MAKKCSAESCLRELYCLTKSDGEPIFGEDMWTLALSSLVEYTNANLSSRWVSYCMLPLESSSLQERSHQPGLYLFTQEQIS